MITHNQQLSLGFDILEGPLLLGHRVLEPERLGAGLLGEGVHLLAKLVAVGAAGSMLLGQLLVIVE